jgi:hypothetical protein
MPTCSSGCTDPHWIRSKSSDGAIISLEDGSVWEVDAVDRIDSGLWLETEDGVIWGSEMINLENGESVHVRRLR